MKFMKMLKANYIQKNDTKKNIIKNTAILITAGGTGGHFFPALALAEELANKKGLDIHVSTDNRCKKYLADNFFPKYNTEKITSSSLFYHVINLYINLTGVLNRLKVPFSIFIALIKSLLLINRIKPSVIIGFGGYPSFPVMFIGQLLGIPTIIYEQNAFLGKTNKFFAKKAVLIALAYQDTKNLPQDLSQDFVDKVDKFLVVGDVTRKNIMTLPPKENFDDESFTLLVIGGSQGAKIFSVLIPESIKILTKNYPEIKINIIQQVKTDDQADVRNIYNKLGITNIISDFFHDIHQHYQKSQLVIARSGASTIAELTQIGLPAIFIPLPASADDHQYQNAKFLQDIGASWVYRQSEITPVVLADKLYDLIRDRSKLKIASQNLLKRKTNGTRHLANTVLKIISYL